MEISKNKMIEILDKALVDENYLVPASSLVRIVERLVEEGIGLMGDREKKGVQVPLKLGASVFVPYFNEDDGVTYIDELKVSELSDKRIWLAGDDWFDFAIEDIGSKVFLSFESASAFFEGQGVKVERGEPAEAIDVMELPGGSRPLCAVGDTVYEVYTDDDGKTYVDETKVLEVSTQRIWVDSNYYDFDEIGKAVFLNRDDVDVYLKSAEYLAERVNMVLHLNVSDEAKREFLVAGFAAGQEYYERDTQKFIKLTHTKPEYIWWFDVLDVNKETLYSTSCLASRLAVDIIHGEIVPGYLQEQAMDKEAVEDLIFGAKERVEEHQENGQEKEAEMV